MVNAPDPHVIGLRRFHRSFARHTGVLDSSFLAVGRPVGSARLLFEIGPAGTTVLALRHRLGLDSGYVSRLLRDLVAEGLAEVDADPADRRRRTVRLTARGRRSWAELDRRSDRAAGTLLSPLSARQRDELTNALASAERLLGVATVRFDVVDPRSDASLTALRAYFAELDRRFPDGFDPGDTLVADAPAMRAPSGAFVVARADDDRVVACGGVQRLDDGTGEIKRMWVDADWRGAGIGGRLLAELERVVERLGYRHVVLDTNATLVEAIAMYERHGYRPIGRYNDNPDAQHWFEKRLDVR